MKGSITAALVICLAPAIAFGAQKKESKITEGLWEITMVTQMEGLPFAMPPITTTVTQCISGENAVPLDPEAEKNCRVKNTRVSGGKVAWEVECTQPEGKSSGSGEMTYTGKTCKGNSRVTVTGDSGTMTAKTKIAGIWTGTCDPKTFKSGEVRRQEELNAAASLLQAYAEEGKKQLAVHESSVAEARELIRTLKVPAEKAGSCDFIDQGRRKTATVMNAAGAGEYGPGGVLDEACAKRFGKLPMNEGEWEITIEHMKEVGSQVFPVEVLTSKGCYSPDAPYGMEGNRPLRRSGNTLAWTEEHKTGDMRVQSRGGYEYFGDRLTGAFVETTSFSSHSGSSRTYDRITGKRIGSCATASSGRAYSSRGLPSVPVPSAGHVPAPPSTPNPVREIRNFFGF